MNIYAFFRGKVVREKNSLFLKKSNVRFFKKQAVFFRGCLHCRKTYIYSSFGVKGVKGVKGR